MIRKAKSTVRQVIPADPRMAMSSIFPPPKSVDAVQEKQRGSSRVSLGDGWAKTICWERQCNGNITTQPACFLWDTQLFLNSVKMGPTHRVVARSLGWTNMLSKCLPIDVVC